MFNIRRVGAEHRLAWEPLEPGWKVRVVRSPSSQGGNGLFSLAGDVVTGPVEESLRSRFDEVRRIVADALGPEAVLPGRRAEDEAIVHVVLGHRQPHRTPGLFLKQRLVVLDGAGIDFAGYGRDLAAHGGPAALRVDAELDTVREAYLAALYRGLAHGVPLSEAARPAPELEAQGLDVELFLGEGGDDLFRRAGDGSAGVEAKEEWRSPITIDLKKVEFHTGRQPGGPAIGGLDAEDQDSTKEKTPPPTTDRPAADPADSGEHTRPNRPGSDFSFGPGPGDYEKSGPRPEDDGDPPAEKPQEDEGTAELEVKGYQTLEPPEEIPPPQAPPPPAPVKPRVLNANFRPLGREKKLGEHEALVAGAEYDFLVDVGPRWPKGESIVAGDATVPLDKLPPVKGGWEIDVALVSESLTPRVATGRIFVPVQEGRQSFPIVDGQQAEHPGPLALRVRAPDADGRSGTFDATARLCLYYRNNLLQSANVRVGVRPEAAGVIAGILEQLAAMVPEAAVQPDEAESGLGWANTIEVDYVLTGTWRDLAAYERRDLRLEEGEGPGLPVLASFTLNGDGSGQHRIIYKDDAELPPAFMPYDAAQAQKTLDTVRARLLECFFLKDPATYRLVSDGAGGWRDGLDDRNGKDRRQFKMDLAILARAGAELYEMVAGNLRPAGMDALEWEERLRASSSKAGVVQVARTGPANFALPWALMYEIPLVEADPARLSFCRSVDEDWGEDGRRRAHAGHTTCRYAGDADHQRDVICPYGFWGLKHVVEQPLGAVDPESGPDVQGASHQVSCEAKIDLAVGITHELGPGGEKLRDEHLLRVSALPGVSHADSPADDWPGVQRVMKAPEVAYFLCHGMYDAEKGDVYLSVGHGNTTDHHIYSKNLISWLRADAGKDWRQRRPLVFVNGCHTFEVEPGHMLNLLSAFNFGRASGVVGTEVKVQLPLAVEAADLLLGSVFAGEPLGKALWKMRWTLAEKGNLLGLAYTMYALADLKVVVQKN